MMSTVQLTVDQIAELVSQMAPDEQVKLMEQLLSSLRRSLQAESATPTWYTREQRFQAIREQTITLDITDLAREHDHYLYGTPKRTGGSAP